MSQKTFLVSHFKQDSPKLDELSDQLLDIKPESNACHGVLSGEGVPCLLSLKGDTALPPEGAGQRSEVLINVVLEGREVPILHLTANSVDPALDDVPLAPLNRGRKFNTGLSFYLCVRGLHETNLKDSLALR